MRDAMKSIKILLSVIITCYTVFVLAASPAGEWITRDDKTGEKRAIIEITEHDSILEATIVKVFPKPGDAVLCKKCPGKLKNKPFLGLQFAWGLKEKTANEWINGSILDPQTGKIYHAKMTLKGNKLYVRGYIGFSVLGRTQIWIRA